MPKNLLFIRIAYVSNLLISSTIFAQSGLLPEFAMGTRSLALGLTATTSFSDPLATSSNPANASNAKRITGSLFYSKLEYGALNTSFGIILPTAKYGAYGVSYFQYSFDYFFLDENGNATGTETFSQRHLRFTHARKIFQSLTIGFNAKFVMQRFGGITPESENVGVDLGLQYSPNFSTSLLRDIAFGLSIDNLVAYTLGMQQHDGVLLREYRFIVEKEKSFSGNSLNIIANLALLEEYSHRNENSVELVKEIGRPKLHLGIEYSRRYYSLRIGRTPNSLTGGVGARIESISIGYAYYTMGSVVHNLSISYEF
ncbi:MAG: hypothetical protein ACREOO_27230 [bacterium]